MIVTPENPLNFLAAKIMLNVWKSLEKKKKLFYIHVNTITMKTVIING